MCGLSPDGSAGSGLPLSVTLHVLRQKGKKKKNNNKISETPQSEIPERRIHVRRSVRVHDGGERTERSETENAEAAK